MAQDLLRSTPYTLDVVADAYNDLMDCKAYGCVLRRSDFPARLLPAGIRCLGTLLADIDVDGATTRVAFAETPSPLGRGHATTPCKWAFAWLNLENATHESPHHSNLLIWHGSSVRRFEPHGADLADAAHTACGFRHFYQPGLLDAAVARTLRDAGLLAVDASYSPPDAGFPVLAQSYTRNDGEHNRNPLTPGLAFKRRNAGAGLGDSFCGAWTLMYLALCCHGVPHEQVLPLLAGNVLEPGLGHLFGAAGDAAKAVGVSACDTAVDAIDRVGCSCGCASGGASCSCAKAPLTVGAAVTDAASVRGGTTTPSCATTDAATSGRVAADRVAAFVLRARAIYADDIARMSGDELWLKYVDG